MNSSSIKVRLRLASTVEWISFSVNNYFSKTFSFKNSGTSESRVAVGPERTGTPFRFFFGSRNGVPVHFCTRIHPSNAFEMLS